ncbi:MAG: tail fiber domain-containing protein [Fimbriimonadales bacterium]|nr:MAG: hypothetical protein KatS3mg018_1586 [Fimbriimonadales bacterium]
MRRTLWLGVVIALAILLASPVVAQPFTYQGFLKQNGQPVNGSTSLTFKLFNALGSQVGPTLTQTVNVQNGLFTVQLDFGAVWDGSDRYLEISVGSTTLSPRVKINPAPYASTAFFAQRPWQTSGSNIFYAAGNVGIGTNSPQGDLHVRSLSAEQLDQETATAFRTGIPGFTWQSFTPAITGVLTKVAVYLDAVNPISLTIRVYQGEGTGGVLLTERTVTPGNFTGWHEVAIGGVNLTAGQRYTVEVMPNGLFIAADNQNPYPNGRSGAGVQFDLLLRTYMALPVESVVVRQGAVGIGTTAPSARLHLVDGNLRIDEGEIQSWGPITLHPDVDNTGDDVVRFVDSTGNETVRIHSNGRVGIGTGNTTPVAPLSFGNTLGNKIALWGSSTTAHYGLGIQTGLLQLYTDQPSSDIAFGVGSSIFTERVRIKGSGPSVAMVRGSFNPPQTDWPAGWDGGLATWDIVCSGIRYSVLESRSDERLKRDIQPLDTSTEFQRLISLRPVSYYWRDKRLPQTLQYGFLAQELREVFPELVSEGVDDENTLAVNYQALIPLLVNALQVQQAEIQQLRAEVRQLRMQLNQKP